MSDAYYRLFPREWDEGTDTLTHEEEVAYIKIVNAICSRGRALEDDEDMNRALARRARLGWAKWKKVKAALVAHGKISIEDGCIVNRRAMVELRIRKEKSGQATEAAIASGEARRNKKQKISEKNSENSEKFSRNFPKNEHPESSKNNALVRADASEPEQEQEPKSISKEKIELLAKQVPAVYPESGIKRVGPIDLRYALMRLVTKQKADPKAFLQACREYGKAEGEFPVNVTKFIDDEIWRNWVSNDKAKPEITDDVWQARLNAFETNRGLWRPEWGPEPGAPGCQVPAHLNPNGGSQLKLAG